MNKYPISIATIQDLDGKRIGLFVQHETDGFSIQTCEGVDVDEGFRYPTEQEAKDGIDFLYHLKEWDLQWDI